MEIIDNNMTCEEKIDLNKNLILINPITKDKNKKIYMFVKRSLDVLFSLFGILFILPIALIVKITYVLSGDKESIFYKQKRVGKNGKIFNLYKFRTMVYNADEVLKDLLKEEKYKEEWNKFQKISNDPRITKIGKFLRKTSLDELPQFFSILKGDMTLIGPRPLIEGELEIHNGNHQLYEKVKPRIIRMVGC